MISLSKLFLAKKYEELNPKQGKKGKEKAKEPKQESKKAEPKAKTEPTLEKPKEEKKKDPFADLPPPTMVFDEWKKKYRNTDTEKEAIPWFWENIDKEGNFLGAFEVFLSEDTPVCIYFCCQCHL